MIATIPSQAFHDAEDHNPENHNPEHVVEIESSLESLRQLALDRPSLSAPVATLIELLPILFVDADLRKLGIQKAAAVEKLRTNVPLLRGQNLRFGREDLERRFVAVCDAICRHEDQPDAESFGKILRDGGVLVEEMTTRVIAGDVDAVASQCESLGINSDLVTGVLRLALFPVMSQLSHELSPLLEKQHWIRGYCPVCGSWPLLAELRGLEQFRILRCGLCAAQWQFSRLRCPFCELSDHHQVGYFHIEGEEAKLRVATCDQCRGYVKTVSTLSALDPRAILVTDLATIHLDLAAVERRYSRPTISSDMEG